MDIVTKVENLNKKYKLNNSNGLSNNSSINYILIYGNIPILLSAPHAVKQIRNGEEKAEDANTGGITEYLCNACKSYGIIRNYNKLDDPNNDNFGFGLEYKNKILDFIKENNIKLVLDIHGCNNSHNFDFCLGTNNRKNLNGQYEILNILSSDLSTIGKVAIDEYFKASLDGNISKYISANSNILSIQIEISNKYRKDEEYLEQLISCLQITIENINKRCLNTKNN